MPTPKGGYRTKNGERVPGTTTILSRFKQSDGLMYWAAHLALDPLMQAYNLAMNGESNDVVVGFLRNCNPDNWDYKKAREKAADAGTAAHDLFDCWIRGVPFDESKYTPETLILAHPAFIAGKEWAQDTKFSVVESEVSLVSEQYKYGGTRDGILINGRRAIADVKTSNAIYPDYLLQLAAYGILDEEEGNTIDGGFHLLKFSKQERPTDPVRFTHFYWSQLDQARKAFLLMRELYDHMKELEKMVK